MRINDCCAQSLCLRWLASITVAIMNKCRGNGNSHKLIVEVQIGINILENNFSLLIKYKYVNIPLKLRNSTPEQILWRKSGYIEKSV